MTHQIIITQIALSRWEQHLQQLFILVRLFGTIEEGGMDDMTLDSINSLVTLMSKEFKAVCQMLGTTLLVTSTAA